MVDERIWAILVVGVIGTVLAACPHGWIQNQSTCYFFSHEKEDWPGAMAICRDIGGTLVKVDDATEGQYLAEQVHTHKKDFWTSLTDIVEEGTWVWMIGHDPLTTTNYINWAPKQPDNGGGNENCVEWLANTKQWNDLACATARNYICEKQDTSSSIIG